MFRLGATELEAWALRAIKLREAISKKATLIAPNGHALEGSASAERAAIARGKGCPGCKRSTASHNIEGRTEKDLKRQAQTDKAFYRKFKKRHRKDLSSEEIRQIVEAAKQPFKSHKDVAQEFKLTGQLVHVLVKEAEKRPE